MLIDSFIHISFRSLLKSEVLGSHGKFLFKILEQPPSLAPRWKEYTDLVVAYFTLVE